MIPSVALALFLLVLPLGGFAAERRLPPRQPPFAKGYVEKLEPAAKRLTLQTRTGLETFTWDQRSRFFRNRQRITPDQLQPGDLVAIRYFIGTNTPPIIHRLKVVPPPSNPSSP